MISRGRSGGILERPCRGLGAVLVVLMIGAGALTPFTGHAQGSKENITTINLWVSHSTVLSFDQPVTKVIVADPEIADINVTSPRHVLITARRVGYTSIIVWGEEEEYYHYAVEVSEKRTKHQVMLQVRFAEMSRGGLKELGAHFIFEQVGKDEEVIGGSFAGRVNSPRLAPLLETNDHEESNKLLDDNVHFFFSILTKKSPYHKLSSIIRALEQKRVLTTLAEPNLVAASGESASFLAGGEFPVPVVQGSAGMQTVTIIFKEFGVKLNFTPTILDSNTIKVQVEPEVSSLDFENGVVLSGFRIPSLLSRKTKTTVELKDGQGLVIGGLLTHEMIETISRVPILGQIPLLGALFSSKRLNDTETELIVLIVPQIIQPLEPDAVESIKLVK